LVLPRSPVSIDDVLHFKVKTAFSSESFAREFAVREQPPGIMNADDHPDLAPAWDQLRLFDQPGEGELWLPTRRGDRATVHFELFTNSYNLFLLLSRPTLRLVL
jgi:hypothetical protein